MFLSLLFRSIRVSSALMLVAVILLFAGCSHTNKYEYSNPDIYEPVFLTHPEFPSIPHDYVDKHLYTYLEPRVTGSPELQNATRVIQDTTPQYIGDVFIPNSTQSHSLQTYSSTALRKSYEHEDGYPSNSYIYDWHEWRDAERLNYEMYYDEPTAHISYHIYTYSNPYDPYWFDPYWSYTRIRSYHAPFHPSYRYGGHYAFAYGYFPHFFPVHHYPYYERKQREPYLVEKPRQERTGVSRNTAPRVTPSSYSSLIRPNPRSIIDPPSRERFFRLEDRRIDTSTDKRQSPSTGSRPISSPRLHFQTSPRADIRSPGRFPSRETYHTPSLSPRRSLPQIRSSRGGRSGVSSPRR